MRGAGGDLPGGGSNERGMREGRSGDLHVSAPGRLALRPSHDTPPPHVDADGRVVDPNPAACTRPARDEGCLQPLAYLFLVWVIALVGLLEEPGPSHHLPRNSQRPRQPPLRNLAAPIPCDHSSVRRQSVQE